MSQAEHWAHEAGLSMAYRHPDGWRQAEWWRASSHYPDWPTRVERVIFAGVWGRLPIDHVHRLHHDLVYCGIEAEYACDATGKARDQEALYTVRWLPPGRRRLTFFHALRGGMHDEALELRCGLRAPLSLPKASYEFEKVWAMPLLESCAGCLHEVYTKPLAALRRPRPPARTFREAMRRAGEASDEAAFHIDRLNEVFRRGEA